MAPLTLPIFPLPIVLFPGTPQFLHVFEPRYQAMISDCMNDRKRFGVSYLDPASGQPHPEPGSIGCVGFINGVDPLPGGRSNIVTTGENRYVLEEYVAGDTPYLVALVEEFDDTPDQESLEPLAEAARAVFRKFVGLIQGLSHEEQDNLTLPGDPKDLSFWMAAALPVDPEIKQKLLEERSTRERLLFLQDTTAWVLEQSLDSLTPRAAASPNGNGRRPPDAELEG